MSRGKRGATGRRLLLAVSVGGLNATLLCSALAETCVTGVDAGFTGITNITNPETVNSVATNPGGQFFLIGPNLFLFAQNPPGIRNVPVVSGFASTQNVVTAVAPTNSGASASASSLGCGAGANASGTGAVAIGAGSSAAAPNSVALGSGSIASQANTVSVGAPGAERRITNVAAGINQTDAVNVGQLQSVAAGFQSQINNNDRRLRDGVAVALAAGGVPAVPYGRKVGVFGNLATYDGHGAAGIGLTGVLLDTRNYQVQGHGAVGVGFDTSVVGGRGGVAVFW
jgi:autotransporter adhesin